MQNDTLPNRYGAKVLARFYPKIDKTESCWIWTSNRGWKGHGYLKVEGRQVAAHRISHEIYKGPIPEGMVIDHICHNTSCVNPEHLRAVLHKQNMENKRRYSGGYFQSIDDAERAAILLRNSLFTHNDVDRGLVIA